MPLPRYPRTAVTGQIWEYGAMTGRQGWIAGLVAVGLTALVFVGVFATDVDRAAPGSAVDGAGKSDLASAETTEGLVLRSRPPQAGDAATASLPPTAVDTEAVPQISVAADASDTLPLPVYRVAPDTYLFFGNIATLNAHNRGFNANAGFVVTSTGVVVIDTLGTPRLGRRMIATIRLLTDRPIRYLIITHNHPDHAYGAVAFRALPGVQIVAHAGSLDYLHSAVLERSVAYRRELLGTDMDGFAPVEPDIRISGERFASTRLSLGGVHFDIYNAGRHHSYGDLVVHQIDPRLDTGDKSASGGVVWVADLAFNQRTTFMGDGDSAQAVAAQDWLLKRFAQARLMIPGHGSAQRAPFPMVVRTRDYMQRLRAEMAAAVEEMVPLQDAVEQSDFADWRAVRLYRENHRANANFVYREMELLYFK